MDEKILLWMRSAKLMENKKSQAHTIMPIIK
jgi:hypothetical protein